MQTTTDRGNKDRMVYLERRLCVGQGRDPIHYGRRPRCDRYKSKQKGRAGWC